MPEAPATSIANASAHAAAKGVDALIAMAASYALDATCEHFYFLRHGQTPCNASRIFQGPDEPLSDLGVRQAKAAAGALASHSIATIVCSSMRRAQQTAALVASEHALTPVDHPGVRERHFGALIGTSSAQIDWACAPEGGETLEALVARTCLGLNQALAHASPTLVVAHGGTLYVNGAAHDSYGCIHDHQELPSQVVPAGNYFVLGDNRPISCDSRDFGLVAADLLKGRVRARFWPISNATVF